MCGIVGGVAERDITPILLEGLKRMEYRGYDSAGLAVNEAGTLRRVRAQGKVAQLAARLERDPLSGRVGVAHTRWATHGVPTETNAHPHLSRETVAVVHNGIIENHRLLRERLEGLGYTFESDTDTEVIAHLIESKRDAADGDLLAAVWAAAAELEGAFALGVIDRDQPERLIACRQGSPLIVGVGIGEHFIASDVQALLPVTQRFVFLEEGDYADLTRSGYRVYDRAGRPVVRTEQTSQLDPETLVKGRFRHFMLKEIHEQPEAITETLEGRLGEDALYRSALGPRAEELLSGIQTVHLVACGTSFHAGAVARYWLESIAGVHATVETASEYRYREPVVPAGTLFLTLSQSGETADTLAALRIAGQRGYQASLSICNVPESSLVRASDLVLMTRAGVEIGVASTKAFTTQLVALMLVVLALARVNRPAGSDVHVQEEARLVHELRAAAAAVEHVLSLDSAIEAWAERLQDKQHALYLGRGAHFPIALEGALKLKEISYIHAEAYAAGELKHGPLALIDAEMPVIVVAPNDELIEKLKSNLEEVRARGGELYVFADRAVQLDEQPGIHVIRMDGRLDTLAPLVHVVPLQLLAYHVAVLRGTDVDQPRNLAKSVTVE